MKYELKCMVDEDTFLDWMPGELWKVEIWSPQKLRGKVTKVKREYEVPAPYDRIIAQLLAEERHGDHNSGHEALHRQSYARRILDKFAQELNTCKGSPIGFRSKVPTPILTRQLAGIPDAYSQVINDAVIGKDATLISIGAATEFYLGTDPTDVSLIPYY
jgi:hypothetical protein